MTAFITDSRHVNSLLIDASRFVGNSARSAVATMYRIDETVFGPINDFIPVVRQSLAIAWVETTGLSRTRALSAIQSVLEMIIVSIAFIIVTIEPYVTPVVNEARFWGEVFISHCADPYAGSDMAIAIREARYQDSVETAELSAATYSAQAALEIATAIAAEQLDDLAQRLHDDCVETFDRHFFTVTREITESTFTGADWPQDAEIWLSGAAGFHIS